jgi:hypothetical protein
MAAFSFFPFTHPLADGSYLAVSDVNLKSLRVVHRKYDDSGPSDAGGTACHASFVQVLMKHVFIKATVSPYRVPISTNIGSVEKHC